MLVEPVCNYNPDGSLNPDRLVDIGKADRLR